MSREVLDYSEYSDTNLEIFFPQKHNFLSEDANSTYSSFPNMYLPMYEIVACESP